VAVVDPVLAPPPPAGQLLHPLAGVPELDPLGVQVGLGPLADQPTGHRVDVALHADGAACLHPHPQPLERLQPAGRQWPKQRDLLGQPGLPPAVELAEQPLEEGGVGVAGREVPAAPEHQGLVEGRLEAVVPLLHVAVLVALAGLDGLGGQPVVVEQGLVTPLEGVGTAAGLDGGGQAVGAVQPGHAAELPQGVLQALAQTLQALGEAKGAGLPVGVGQDEVVDQVGERGALEGHAQLGAVGEVGRTQAAGVVKLAEEDLPGGAMLGPPLLDPSLQGPQLPIGEASGVLPLQGLEERLGLEGRVEGQLPLGPGPDVVEGVLACSPVVLHGNLAGQGVLLPVLACGLAVDAGPGGGQRKRSSLLQGPAETADLLVGDHRHSFPIRSSMVSTRPHTGEF
jgi:hypothetical protein